MTTYLDLSRPITVSLLLQFVFAFCKNAKLKSFCLKLQPTYPHMYVGACNDVFFSKYLTDDFYRHFYEYATIMNDNLQTAMLKDPLRTH
jgi:hypothetical protein